MVCGDINAVTLTLGAGAGVTGAAAVTTATLGANAYVLGNVSATTLTLGANSCYGGGFSPTTTVGAGASSPCGAVSNSCITTTTPPVGPFSPDPHGGTAGHDDGSSHTHDPANIHSH